MNKPLATLLRKLGCRFIAWGDDTPVPFPGTLCVGGKIVSELRPLGGFHQPGVTKAGRLSFAGFCEGRKVKVYSAFSSEQIALRHAVQEVDLGGCAFPEIVASDDHLVAEAWIEGASAAVLKGNELSHAEAAIREFLYANRHSELMLRLAKGNVGAFCYLQDYLIKRLSTWQHWSLLNEFVSDWQRTYESVCDESAVCLSHPDLSLNNLVYERKTKKLYLIDNELLGVGVGWVLDWKNSLIRSSAAPAYHAGVSPEFMEKTWRLRRVGSALDANDFKSVLGILENTKSIDSQSERKFS